MGPGKRTMVTGMPDGTLLVWDMSPEKWKLPPKTAIEKPVNVRQLWADLKADARTALHAANLLAESPADCLTLFRESLKPAPGVNGKEIEDLIGELDDRQFNVRESAMKELRQKRDEVDDILKQRLEKTKSLEVRRRLKEILASSPPAIAGDALRDMRAVGVLEWIGSAEAKDILQKLASGAAGVPIDARGEGKFATIRNSEIDPIVFSRAGRGRRKRVSIQNALTPLRGLRG